MRPSDAEAHFVPPSQASHPHPPPHLPARVREAWGLFPGAELHLFGSCLVSLIYGDIEEEVGERVRVAFSSLGWPLWPVAQVMTKPWIIWACARALQINSDKDRAWGRQHRSQPRASSNKAWSRMRALRTWRPHPYLLCPLPTRSGAHRWMPSPCSTRVQDFFSDALLAGRAGGA